jgi:ribonuclease P protein component
METPTLSKQERLFSRKLIETLFSGGSSQSMAAFPVRAVYIIKERAHEEPPVQLLVSVSKRHFKHAVDRNRVKRQIREAYRQNKQLLTEAVPESHQLLMALIWLADEHYPSWEIEKRVLRLLQRIAEKL